MGRCDYCKKQGASQKTAVRIWDNGKLKTMELPYCSDSCKQKLHSFALSYNRFAPKFMPFVLVWLLFFIGVPFLLRAVTGSSLYINLVSPLLLAFMGAILILSPQGVITLKYYQRVGIRYFTFFIRVTGLLMIAAGLSIIWQ